MNLQLWCASHVLGESPHLAIALHFKFCAQYNSRKDFFGYHQLIGIGAAYRLHLLHGKCTSATKLCVTFLLAGATARVDYTYAYIKLYMPKTRYPC